MSSVKDDIIVGVSVDVGVGDGDTGCSWFSAALDLFRLGREEESSVVRFLLRRLASTKLLFFGLLCSCVRIESSISSTGRFLDNCTSR